MLAVDGFFLSILLNRVHSPVSLSYVAPSQSFLALHLSQHLNKDVAKAVSISVPISSVLPMTRHGQVPSVVKIKTKKPKTLTYSGSERNSGIIQFT